MPLTFLNSTCAIIDPTLQTEVLDYRICTFIHLTLKPNQSSNGRNYFPFLTAGHDIWEYLNTVCWELQDFSSYRLKVNNCLGFTDYYTHPEEVSKCQRCASSSCPVFQVLQVFAAASPGHSFSCSIYALDFLLCFSQAQKQEGGKEGKGSLMFITTGNIRLHGWKLRVFLFRNSLSIPYNVEKPPHPQEKPMQRNSAILCRQFCLSFKVHRLKIQHYYI